MSLDQLGKLLRQPQGAVETLVLLLHGGEVGRGGDVIEGDSAGGVGGNGRGLVMATNQCHRGKQC